MKQLEVSAAIILKNEKILCAQRDAGKYEYVSYKFEFPGGKLEQGENPREALHRELIEEMDVEIAEEDMEEFYVVEHDYPDFHIKMHCFLCYMKSETINLKEHISMKWADLESIKTLDWAPADFPVVEALVKRGF